jgi:hypothetical protein
MPDFIGRKICFMKELIQRYDVNNIQLKEGDIVAESTIGKEIWEGAGIVESRPLGIIVVYHNPRITPEINVEETDCYNVMPIRKGRVKLTDKAKEWHRDRLSYDGEHTDLNISRYDGDFYAWDSIEKIGSIYDFCD